MRSYRRTPVGCLLTESYDATSSKATTKHLVAFVLTAEVNTCLDNILRFLGCCHGDNHYHACKQEIERRSLGALHKRGHKIRICRYALSICSEVEIRIKSCQRHTNKVYKVVACKCHSQSKGTHQHYELEDVNLNKLYK